MRWLSRLVLLSLSLIDPSVSDAAFARITSNAADSDTSSTTISVQLSGVTATNTIVCWVKREGADSITTTVSDGTSSLTSRPQINSDTVDIVAGQFFYLLSSVASGTVTYTATFSSAATYRVIGCYELSADNDVVFDVSNGSGADSQAGNTITSGTVTTTGTAAVAFGGYGEASTATFSAPLINGVAADHTQNTSIFGRMWMEVLSATFSNGAATASLDSGVHAATGILVLKENVGGGGAETFGFRRRIIQ